MSILFDKNAPVMVIRSLFDRYDEDRNGKLSSKTEFPKLLDNELGLSTDEQEICALLMNKQENGMIAFEDFREWFMNNKNYLQIITDPAKHDILVHAVVYFRKYDHDASDGLDVEQFGELLSEHGYTPVQVQNEFDRVDLNKNGIVSFYEFLKWLKWIDI